MSGSGTQISPIEVHQRSPSNIIIQKDLVKSGRLMRATCLSCMVAIALVSLTFWVPNAENDSKNHETALLTAEPPVFKFYPAAHSVFVTNLATAKHLLSENVKFSAPCAFGVDCRLHFRPTLREHTDGRWLHEGEGPSLVDEKAVQKSLSTHVKAFYEDDLAKKENGASSYTQSAPKSVDPATYVLKDEKKPAPEVVKEDNGPAEALKRSEAAIRAKIANLEAKYGKDLST